MSALAQWMPDGRKVIGESLTAPEGDDDPHAGWRTGGQEGGDAAAYGPLFASGDSLGLGGEARPSHVVIKPVDDKQELPPVTRALRGGFGEERLPRPRVARDGTPLPAEENVDLVDDFLLELGADVRAVGRGDEEGQDVGLRRGPS